MDFILILVIALLLGVAVWLWRLSQAEMIDLSLETSLAPKQDVATSPISKPRKTKIWYKKIRGWFRTAVYLFLIILFLAVVIGVVLVVIEGIYPLVKAYTWESLLLILIVTLATFITSKSESKRGYYNKKMSYDFDMPSGMKIEYITKKEYRHQRLVKYGGDAKLPKKVYEGDSHNITINLNPIFPIPTTSDEPLHIQDTKSGKKIVMQISRDSGLDQFLEIELLAAGLSVDGEKKQRQSLTSQTLAYMWNVYFPNSGDHTLTLILRLISNSETIELGSIPHNIKVVKLDHLTQRQVWLLASAAGIVSGVLTLTGILYEMGML